MPPPVNIDDYEGKCHRRGMNSQDVFDQLIATKGGRSIESSSYEDKVKHIDRWVYGLISKPFSVDVRSISKVRVNPEGLSLDFCNKYGISESDSDCFTLLETVGKKRTRGRFFGSHSHIFAQDRQNRFDLYEIPKIIEYLNTEQLTIIRMSNSITKNDEPDKKYRYFKLYLRLDGLGQHSGEFIYVPTRCLNDFAKPFFLNK